MLRLRISLLGVIAICATLQSVSVQSLSQPVVRVCQNKSCLKRNGCLLQTISNLVTSTAVESSGCLSHCTDGPNVAIENEAASTILSGVYDAPTAAVLLEEALGAPIPKVLVAASKLMEKVPHMESREGMRYLDSVVSKLEESDYAESPAMTNALALRAKVSLSLDERRSAIQDAHRAVKLKNAATAATLTMAYRVWADAEVDPSKVVAILQKWLSDQPNFRAKLQTEIQDVLESMQNDEVGEVR